MSKFEVDEKEVNKIVETMKKKYRDDGIEFDDEVNSSLKELRGIITNQSYSRIDIETNEDIETFSSDIAKQIGSFYLKFKDLITPIKEFIRNFPISEELGFYLYSANMRYSPNQYLALSAAGGIVVALVLFIMTLLVTIALGNIVVALTVPLLIGFLTWIIATIIILSIPKSRAISRGNACSTELPFALRHMSTELKAGIGLYKTIQAIARNDYGVLSDEFARTITEIEEGSDTRVALKHLALRTQSKPLKKTINHILRAMRIGGNLSSAMNDIAEDVSEDMRNKILEFSQSMNFFAVIFIFVGIVMPVAIMILGAIRNSSIGLTGQNVFENIPLTPEILLIFFLGVMPLLYFFMVYMVYKTQPQV
jgi:flagellar protein FlaJ